MNLSFFKQKKFGLPVWAWAVISAVIIFGIYYYIKKRNANSSSSTSTSSPDTSSTDSSNLPLSTLPYDSGGGFGGSGSYTGWSPQTTPNQQPLIVEIQQTPTTNPDSTSTIPPASTADVSTLAGSNALLESIFTPQTAPFAPTTGVGSQSATPGGDSANQQQGVFAVDTGGGLVNAPPVKVTSTKSLLAPVSAGKPSSTNPGGLSANKKQGVFATH